MKKKNIILASLITGMVFNNNIKSRKINKNDTIKYKSKEGEEVNIKLLKKIKKHSYLKLIVV